MPSLWVRLDVKTTRNICGRYMLNDAPVMPKQLNNSPMKKHLSVLAVSTHWSNSLMIGWTTRKPFLLRTSAAKKGRSLSIVFARIYVLLSRWQNAMTNLLLATKNISRTAKVTKIYTALR